MNCLFEALAEIYLRTRARFIPELEDTICDAEENLEACRTNLLAKDRELSTRCTDLARDALRRRNAGDLPAARLHLQERRRCSARLDKLRNGVALLDKQLDALRSSELDKELMHSLRVSTQAMKKAGIGIGVEEAEKVMIEAELDLLCSEHADDLALRDDTASPDSELTPFLPARRLPVNAMEPAMSR
jgi:hypothetical protein